MPSQISSILSYPILKEGEQGPEWILAKKSEKSVTPSLMGDARGMVKEM